MMLLRAVAACVVGLAVAHPCVAAAPTQPAAPLLSAPALPGGPSRPHPVDADAAMYQRCMSLAQKDPAATRRLAEGWQRRGGAHPAAHCLAVALIGLQQYGEAATQLEKLAQDMTHAPASLRADVLGQAAQAWLLAGDPARAYAADGAALGLRPGDPDLLTDRAEAAGAAGWFDKVVADLDPVLKADPKRLTALIYRASAYRELGRLGPALADIEKALELAPDSVPALLERGNIRRLNGDADGARADWDRVVQLAPGSTAETAAKANIERLALPAGAPPARPAAAR